MKYFTIVVLVFLILTCAQSYTFPHRSLMQYGCAGFVLKFIHFDYADNHNIDLISKSKTHFKRGKK